MAIAATFACTEKQNLVPEARPENLKEFSFTASFEQDDATKTVLNADLSVDWVVNDSIAVYDGSEIREFIVREVRDDKTAVIGGLADASASSFYAVYPKKALLDAVADTLKLALPEEQVVPAGMNFSPDALVSFAKLDSGSGRFKFKNMTSLVKVTIPKEASRILVKNLGGIASSGTATLTANPEVIPTVQAISGSTTTYIVPESGKFQAGSYFIPVIPSEFPSGIAISVSQEDGYLVAETSDSLALVRNSGLDFGDISTSSKTVLAPFNIGSLADLKAFTARTPYYAATDVVTITADIDIQGEEWVCAPSTRRYYGSIDGGKHRIYNYIIKSGPDTGNLTDAAVFGRVGQGAEAYPYFIKDLAFATKDYDFETGIGTYDGVSKVIFNTQNDGKDTYFYPGAVAYCYAYGTIDNLASFAPVEIPASCTTPHRGSPLLGTVKANVTIRGCRNFADLSEAVESCTKAPTVAGISGALDGANCVVENCVNEGTITVTSELPSDYAGLVGYTNYVSTYKGCVNKGEVISKHAFIKDSYIGGLTSRSTREGTTFTDCRNEGKVTVEGKGNFHVFVGGICGRLYSATATNCDNYGAINVNITNGGSKKYSYVGGCFANTNVASGSTAPNILSGCDNNAPVTVEGSGNAAYVAGVLGYNAHTLEISDCHNLVDGVVTNKYAGKTNNYGVAGVLQYATKLVEMSGCSNDAEIYFEAPVTVNVVVGGVAGIFGGTTEHVITDCKTNSAIHINATSGTKNGALCSAGGIIANLYGSEISNCEVSGGIIEVKGESADAIPTYVLGGITAGSYYAHGTIKSCNAFCSLCAAYMTNVSYMGGITGILSHKEIKDCCFKGELINAGSNPAVGGIAGAALNETSGLCKSLQALESGDGLVSKARISINNATTEKVGTVVGYYNSSVATTIGANVPVVASEATVNDAAGSVLGSASAEGLTINVAQ